jgi:glycosyltransferase involved in cell wall biosynthesis
MIIIVNSKVTGSDIQHSLGKPEYSYYFLLKEFLPALTAIAKVIEASPAEVDVLYQQYSAAGEQVLFLSVSPPHQTPVNLHCPTYCLFAWEFHDVPNLAWDNEPRNDWRYVFERIAGAIACSEESAQAVRNLMGPDYPVTAIPAPVWDRFQSLYPEPGWLACFQDRQMTFTGNAIDSPALGLSADGLVQHMPRPSKTRSVVEQPKSQPGALRITAEILGAWLTTLWRNQLGRAGNTQSGPLPAPHAAGSQTLHAQTFCFSGVVFTSVLNPDDGRKNWVQIVTAFCWAFKDNPDATLILKMTHHDLEYFRIPALTLLSRLAPFQCRVLLLHGYLSDQEYQSLVSISDFYVNASTGEGLCLPLMEFLSAGKPVIAPRHTAMLDYIDDDIAFLIETCEEPGCWPHNPMSQLQRLNWESLMLAYRAAYQTATDSESTEYQAMSQRAFMRMQTFASIKTVAHQLATFLGTHCPDAQIMASSHEASL